jgi:tRNA(Ile)-lysidine synthase
MNVLSRAIDAVPAGRWAVAVSGGADSVALLRLLSTRQDLLLHVVHLDHQTRAQASTDDARFVAELAGKLRIACTIALRSEIEPSLADPPENPSARYRAARLELYRRVVGERDLNGVILAHHADDQAETVLQRLIRGASAAGLCGMSPQTRFGELLTLRPLLCLSRDDLRNHLREIGQSWREDESNQSVRYLRNRLRRWLAEDSELKDALLELCLTCRSLRDWTKDNAPRLAESFRTKELQSLPALLARESARRWLRARGGGAEELAEAALDRLIEMATDAASASRQTFAGNVTVSRRGGRIEAVH